MNKKLRKSFILQHDQSDCGVACLLSVLKYYNSNSSLERLRELSGTDKQGTTLLGLYQAANEIGFEAKGMKADIESISKFQEPVILHILKDKQLEHYVVFYGIKDDKFVVGDPAEGIKYLSAKELDEIWKTKHCLILKQGKTFISTSKENSNKRRWFLKLLKEDSNILISSVLIGFILTILSMATAIVTQKLIDNILPSKNTIMLFLVMAFLFFILSIRSISSYLRSIFLIKQNRNFNNRIVNYFYSSLLNLPKSFFDTRSIGDMVARLNDTSRIQQFISQLAGNIVIDALMFTVSLFFVFYYSKIFGLTSLTFFSIYFFLIRLQTKTVVEKQRKIMGTYAQVETNYISTIGGISEIKNFNTHSVFNQQNTEICQKHQDNIYSLGKFQAKLNIVNGLLSSIFLVSIFGFGAYQVIHQELKLGIFMAIFGISSSLLPYITNLAMMIIPLNEAKIAFNRMYEFTGLPPESSAEELNLSFNEIQIKNLSFRFAGRRQLFSNVSFDVKIGEIISIVGENGSGKSTITQILSKFYNFESGNIIVNQSFPLESLNFQQWRNNIAIVPQNIHIFNGTVIENICMQFGEQDFNESINYLQSIGLLKYFNELPSGLMTIVGEIGINLSGGQRQLIAIARALLKQPKLLILDETTSAMDSDKENTVLQLLNEIKHKMAIIFITHRLHILRNLADNIYILENGKTEISGNHLQLMQSDNFYSKFWKQISEG